jgi:hypothetical protein
VDISYPPFWRGATKEQIERAMCFRFLATLAEDLPFTFPLEIVHADKPDFRFIMNSTTIGAECTLALPEQYTRALFLREKFCLDVPLDPSDFRWATPDRTSAELLVLLKKNKLTGLPWFGDGVEREWALAMEDCIDAKTDNLNAQDFVRFQTNWLLIQDVLPGGSLLEVDRGLFHLSFPLERYFNAHGQTKFDHIFIKTHGKFLSVNSAKAEIRTTNDLWQKHGK